MNPQGENLQEKTSSSPWRLQTASPVVFQWGTDIRDKENAAVGMRSDSVLPFFPRPVEPQRATAGGQPGRGVGRFKFESEFRPGHFQFTTYRKKSFCFLHWINSETNMIWPTTAFWIHWVGTRVVPTLGSRKCQKVRWRQKKRAEERWGMWPLSA